MPHRIQISSSLAIALAITTTSACVLAAAQGFVFPRIDVADREARCVPDQEMAALSGLDPPRPWEIACARFWFSTYIGSKFKLLGHRFVVIGRQFKPIAIRI
jgi:hypothetical protein